MAGTKKATKDRGGRIRRSLARSSRVCSCCSGGSLVVAATATVRSATRLPLAAGETDPDFTLNGVFIGPIQVRENDADGVLVVADAVGRVVGEADQVVGTGQVGNLLGSPAGDGEDQSKIASWVLAESYVPSPIPIVCSIFA